MLRPVTALVPVADVLPVAPAPYVPPCVVERPVVSVLRSVVDEPVVDVPVWLRREVSVVPELVLPADPVWATAVAAPSKTAMADAIMARRLAEKEWFGFIAFELYAPQGSAPWEEDRFRSPAYLLRESCGSREQGSRVYFSCAARVVGGGGQPDEKAGRGDDYCRRFSGFRR